MRRTLVRCFLVCWVTLCTGCSWWQNEFFSLDRAAPGPERPAAELAASTEPRW